jgi:hypothetical protein
VEFDLGTRSEADERGLCEFTRAVHVHEEFNADAVRMFNHEGCKCSEWQQKKPAKKLPEKFTLSFNSKEYDIIENTA